MSTKDKLAQIVPQSALLAPCGGLGAYVAEHDLVWALSAVPVTFVLTVVIMMLLPARYSQRRSRAEK
ncbi:hypothetical protein [Nocardioides montaniterrae]